MRIIGKVPRVTGLTRERFQSDYVALDQPVIVAQALDEWPALTRWSPEYVARVLGGQHYHFKSSTSDAHPDFRKTELKEMFAREALTFEEFFSRILTGPAADRCRLMFSGDEHFLYRVRDGVASLNPELGALWPDVVMPDLVPVERLYTVWAWFSGRGVRTWLHYDNNGCHNLNAQLSGSKEALLFAPSERDKLSLFPEGGRVPATNCSELDVDAPDLVRFPGYANAEAIQATLIRGDLLFIPANWLHTFVHIGELNTNVNFWWKP
jgi:Cupin-like domain